MSARPVLLVTGLVAFLGCAGHPDTTQSSMGAGAAPMTSGTAGSGTAGSGASATSSSAGGGDACDSCTAPTVLTTLNESAIVENSGIAPSAIHDGVFYVHNDSGDTARFFAVDKQGKDQGTFNVQNAQAIDWEDIARGPCADPSQSCLYLGDIGDNNSVRKSYTVYRVAEPTTLGPGDHSVTAEVFQFVYPDGAHNAETLLVHPSSGEVSVVTKGFAGSTAYTFPLPLDGKNQVTLSKVGSVKIPEMLQLITAGDVHPQGKGVLLRSYGYVFYYAMKEGDSAASALSRAPCELPNPSEQQGEGICFLPPSGKGFLTTSEGKNQPVHQVLCSML